MDTLNEVIEYGLGGLTLIGGWYVNVQAIKRAGWMPARIIPLVNLILGFVLMAAWMWMRPVFVLVSGSIVLSGLATVYHGGTKKLAESPQPPKEEEHLY